MYNRILLLLTMGLLFAPGTLHADAFDDCRQNADLDLKITACTKIIQCDCLSDAQKAVAHIQRGVGLSISGDELNALNDLIEAIQLDPENLNAYFVRGRIYNNLGEYEAAIRDYDNLYEARFYPVHILIARGGVYNNMGKFERAIEDYDEALRLEPDNAEAHNDRGASLSALGDFRSAISEYDQALAFDPGFSAAYQNRAYAQLWLGNLAAAVGDAEVLVGLLPERAESHATLGLMLCRNGQVEEAAAALAKARDVEPPTPDDVELQRIQLATLGFKDSEPDLDGIAALEVTERDWIVAGCPEANRD